MKRLKGILTWKEKRLGRIFYRAGAPARLVMVLLAICRPLSAYASHAALGKCPACPCHEPARLRWQVCIAIQMAVYNRIELCIVL